MSAVSQHEQIRALKKALAKEQHARTIAEYNMKYFREQAQTVQLSLAESDGMKSVRSKRRLTEDEIRGSQLFQSLESDCTRLSQQLESYKLDRVAQQESMADGRSEIQRQLQFMLTEAVLLPARRQYYERLIKDLNLHGLMTLHRNMKFVDDRD